MEIRDLHFLLNDALESRDGGVRVHDVDFTSEQFALLFTWRGKRFRVSTILHVEELRDGELKQTNETWLMSRLLAVTESLEVIRNGTRTNSPAATAPEGIPDAARHA